jgi:hypothetical protein
LHIIGNNLVRGLVLQAETSASLLLHTISSLSLS